MPDSALTWRKSTYSSSGSGDCVEVAPDGANVAVRDSKNPSGGELRFSSADWKRFTDEIKNGSVTLP